MGSHILQALVHHEQYLKHNNSETDGEPVQSYQNWSDVIKLARLSYQSCRTVLNTLMPFQDIFWGTIVE